MPAAAASYCLPACRPVAGISPLLPLAGRWQEKAQQCSAWRGVQSVCVCSVRARAARAAHCCYVHAAMRARVRVRESGGQRAWQQAACRRALAWCSEGGICARTKRASAVAKAAAAAGARTEWSSVCAKMMLLRDKRFMRDRYMELHRMP